MMCVSLALFAIGITLYPLISNYFAEVNRSLIETKYTKAVEQMDDSEIIGARMDAQQYNATLLTITDEPYTKEALQQASESYEGLLNVRGDGIMGYLEIPKLGVELPIFHGTEEETLDRGLGHLLGSSLPVGGTGTHCVITGHSGLAGRRMFSDLDKLELMEDGMVDMKPMISEHITLDEFAKGIDLVRNRPAGFVKALYHFDV